MKVVERNGLRKVTVSDSITVEKINGEYLLVFKSKQVIAILNDSILNNYSEPQKSLYTRAIDLLNMKGEK